MVIAVVKTVATKGGENMKEKSLGKMDMEKYIGTLEDFFGKFPPLPSNIKGTIVKIAPWLALVFGVLGILSSIAATGFLTFINPLMAIGGGAGLAVGGVVGGLLGVVGSVLTLMAFPGLRDRKTAGWRWSFYSQVVSIISGLVALNLVGAAVGGLIGFYLLFQVKNYYK